MSEAGKSLSAGPRFQAVVIVLLAAWLGVTLFVWFSAGVTFNVLSARKNPELAARFGRVPPAARERALRRAAGEVNRRMFRGWNRAQLAGGLAALGFMFAGGRGSGGGRGRAVVYPAAAALAVVCVHAFWLGPGIEQTGRLLGAGGAAAAEASARFGMYHGVYVVSDLLKAALLAWALWGACRVPARSGPGG